MKTKKEEKKPVYGHGVYHPGARPMQVYLDQNGRMWLCDKGIDLNKDFKKQGCWRCEDLAFTRDD